MPTLTCPNCGDRAAYRHCPDGKPCEWLRCSSCKATVDPVARRGFIVGTGAFTLDDE